MAVPNATLLLLSLLSSPADDGDERHPVALELPPSMLLLLLLLPDPFPACFIKQIASHDFSTIQLFFSSLFHGTSQTHKKGTAINNTQRAFFNFRLTQLITLFLQKSNVYRSQ